jgi:hypothetical protein
MKFKLPFVLQKSGRIVYPGFSLNRLNIIQHDEFRVLQLAFRFAT